MKLYVSEEDNTYEDLISNFDRVDYEDSDTVLILPGSLGSLNDLLTAIIDKKKTFVYNKDSFYDPFIKNIYDSKLRSNLDDIPEGYLEIENDIEKIIEKMEEENERTNNGKNGKLL